MSKVDVEKFMKSAEALSRLVGVLALSYEQVPGAIEKSASTMIELRKALPEVTELMHRQAFIGMTRTYMGQYSAVLAKSMPGLIKQAWDVDINARR